MLVRLLHPDQHTDLALKAAADGQLKRLNQIYAVLADPERRRRYNAELSATDERQAPVIIQARRHLPVRNQKNYFEQFAWIAAVLLSIGLIGWLASRDAGSPANFSPSTIQSQPAKEQAKSLQKVDRPSEETISSLKQQLRTAIAQRDEALRQLAQREATGVRAQAVVPPLPSPEKQELFLPSEPPTHRTVPSIAVVPPPSPLSAPAAPMLPSAALPQAIAVINRPHLAGAWVWAKPHAANKHKNLYPPEFIEASIAEQNGLIRGQYRARYRVKNRAVSPDVNFEFTGKAAESNVQLPWQGDGGAKGEVKLKLISDNSLEIVWSASELGKKFGLASGNAILVRRAP